MVRHGGGCSHPGCGQLIGVSEAAGAGLLRCTKCRRRIYCSKECQKAALQEALRAALLGTTRCAPTDRQDRVFEKMAKAYEADNWGDADGMA